MSRIADRKARIERLLTMIRQRGDMPIKKVLAQFCFETGTTPFTARRYLQLLIDADELEESVLED